MTTQNGASLRIFTYKEGLLSKVAHDLRISAADFTLKVDGAHVEVVVPVHQLQVDGAMKRGELRPKTLSEKDKRDIVDNMRKDVLRSGVYPQVRFEGQADNPEAARFKVDGELELAGRKHPLSVSVERAGERFRAKVALKPSRWGIKPFSALLGTLKVKDFIEVEIEAGAE